MNIMYRIYYKNKDELEAQLLDFKILFAYHSNKIENQNTDYHDTRDIFEKGKVSNYTGDLRTLFEIQNQKDCYHFLLDKIIDKVPLSIPLIKKIHYELSKGTYDSYRYDMNHEIPGEFKKHDYITGKYEVGSYPENVESDLQELLEEINEYEGEDVFTVASYLHACFENIHPFADANGRTGRTIMNYYLLIHNVSPIIIYEENRKEYYDCLEKFDVDSKLQPLKNFIIKQQEKTWTRQPKKAIKLNDIMNNNEMK